MLPTEVYLMTIPEINLFLSQRTFHENEIAIASSWRTINFLGAFMSEKFQALERYLPENPRRREETKAKKEALKEKLIKISSKR